MSDFEDQLRGALRRREPAAGFAERVIARANPARRPKPIWIAAAIAATVVVAIPVQREYQQRRAEEAGRQTVLALQITAEKLNVLRGKVLTHLIETENQ
jgi:hypothetical protein